ncbi:hypothetical protein VTI74DRAFT_6917 [Chaetomium olivicolor]
MRYLPAGENGGAGQTFRSVCFRPHLEALTPAEFKMKWDAVPLAKKVPMKGTKVNSLSTSIQVDDPGFTLWKWDEWYKTHTPNPRYDFALPYQKRGPNGD